MKAGGASLASPSRRCRRWPKMKDQKLEILVAECRRIQQYAKVNAGTHFSTAAVLRRVHMSAGVLPIILGALATCPAWKEPWMPQVIGSYPLLWASVFSVASAISGSIISLWNLGDTRTRCFVAAARYKTLENRARRAADFYSVDEAYDAFKRRVEELCRTYDDLGESSPLASDWGFKRAMRKINEGLYEPDEQSGSAAQTLGTRPGAGTIGQLVPVATSPANPILPDPRPEGSIGEHSVTKTEIPPAGQS